MERFARLFSLGVILLEMSGCATPYATLPPPEDLVFPGTRWERMTDSAGAGWSPELLAEARELSQEIGSASVMIVQGA